MANTIKQKIDALELQRASMQKKLEDRGVIVSSSATMHEMIDHMYDVAKPALDDYKAIQEVVQSGQAPNVFKIGDQIKVKYNSTYDYPFRVVHFENVTLQDGSVVPGMIVQAVYTEHNSVAFDTSRRNRWAVATGRTWLQDTFKSRITPEFVNILKPVKIETLRNYVDSDTKGAGAAGRIYDTTYDLFFPPTTTNMACQAGTNIDPVYGVCWSYWASNNNRYARIIRSVTSPTAATGEDVYLRSAYRSYADRVHCLDYKGNSGYIDPSYSRRFAPACVIC